MESLVINPIRRHLLLLDIISHGKSCNKLEDIYCCWIYFPMESLVINRIRRHLLSLDIFSHGKSSNKLQDIYCCWLYLPWKFMQ